MWQDIAALGLVGITLAVAVRGVITQFRTRRFDACSSCPGSGKRSVAPPAGTRLISPESLLRRTGRR